MKLYRPFVLSIPSGLDNIETETVDELYFKAGCNTGNFVYVSAIARLLKIDAASCGLSVSKAEIEGKYDCLVVLAANWLHPTSDLDLYSNIIESLDLPCIVIGLGAQSPDTETVFPLNESVLRFLRLVSARSACISLRGDYTQKVLAAHGMFNGMVTGCPSLLTIAQSNRLLPAKRQAPLEESEIVVHSTRFDLIRRVSEGLQTNLYRYAFRNSATLLLQSEKPEIYFALGRENAFRQTEDVFGMPYQMHGHLLELYDAKDSEWPTLMEFLRTRVQIFFSVDQWVDFLRNFQLIVGTRIHGTICGLLAGRPSCLITHDARTEELARTMNIPCVQAKHVPTHITGRFFQDLYEAIDLEKFNNGLEAYKNTFQQFFERNGLITSLESPQ